jgi:hypothetical protein
VLLSEATSSQLLQLLLHAGKFYITRLEHDAPEYLQARKELYSSRLLWGAIRSTLLFSGQFIYELKLERT